MYNHRDAMHNELRVLAAQFRAHNQQAFGDNVDHNTSSSSTTSTTPSLKEKSKTILETSFSASDDLFPLNHPYGQMPGIEDLILEDDDSNLVESLTCQICLEIFDDPVVMACGHTFCRKCIKQEMKSRQRCPLDRRNLGGNAPMFRNTTVAHLIDGLPMRCSRGVIYNTKTHTWEPREDGCDAIIRVKNLESHLKYECGFVEDRCDQVGCAARFLRRDLLDHQSSCSGSFDDSNEEEEEEEEVEHSVVVDDDDDDDDDDGFSTDDEEHQAEVRKQPIQTPAVRARSASKLWLFAKQKLGGKSKATSAKKGKDSKRNSISKSKSKSKRNSTNGNGNGNVEHQTKMKLKISTTSARNTTRTTSKVTITKSGDTVTTKTTTTTSSSNIPIAPPPPQF